MIPRIPRKLRIMDFEANQAAFWIRQRLSKPEENRIFVSFNVDLEGLGNRKVHDSHKIIARQYFRTICYRTIFGLDKTAAGKPYHFIDVKTPFADLFSKGKVDDGNIFQPIELHICLE